MRKEIKASNCIVAFLDLLGFKEYVNNNNSEIVLNTFKTVQSLRKQIDKDKIIFFGDKSKEDAYNQLSDSIYMRIMSDSIVIATDVFSKEGLLFVSKWISLIQAYLLEIGDRIMSRGGISYGEFYGDEEIMFGKGMIQAYLLEGKAKYPRVIIDKYLLKKFYDLNSEEFTYEDSLIRKDNEYDERFYVSYLLNIDWYNEKDEIERYINSNLKLADSIKEKYQWLSEKSSNQIDILEARIEADKFAKENPYIDGE